MGQAIVVTTKPGARPGTVHFDCNRSLTGMALERYPAGASITRHRPPDALARQLFELGARSVTIYSNVVTVELEPESGPGTVEAMADAVTNLFIYYRPGVEVVEPAGVAP